MLINGVSGYEPAQAASQTDQAMSSYQVGMMKKSMDLQKDVVSTLLQSAGIGNNVNIQA